MPRRRETSIAVMRRSIAALRRLQRGPASKSELIEAMEIAEPDSYYEVSGRALDKRFEGDKRRLQEIFGLKLRYSRATAQYELVEIWEPVLDFPDDALQTMVFLQQTFGPAAPNYENVQRFLGLIASYLPPERRGVVESQRQTLAISWGQRDDDVLAPQVEEKLQKALLERRLVTFDYLSPAYPDERHRQHTVEPWEKFFDPQWGHYYLRGYCRSIREPDGNITQPRQYYHYRLGRISNVSVLPDKLSWRPPTALEKLLVYRLAPQIARHGNVTQHVGITITRTEIQPDGAVVVYAQTESLWWALRILLHYGATCEILGGPEALAEMRQIVGELADLYGLRENPE